VQEQVKEEIEEEGYQKRGRPNNFDKCVVMH
jgi:hypothetical protein